MEKGGGAMEKGWSHGAVRRSHKQAVKENLGERKPSAWRACRIQGSCGMREAASERTCPPNMVAVPPQCLKLVVLVVSRCLRPAAKHVKQPSGSSQQAETIPWMKGLSEVY